MNGIHDMGGMHGFGAVDPTDSGPWHDHWEGRVFALTLAASRHLRSNLDRGRFQLETLPPDAYLRGYFERWFARLIDQAEDAGFIDAASRAAIDHGTPVPARTKDREPLPAEALVHVAATGRPTARDIDTAPVFAVGEAVRARNLHPAGHTRLPGYVRGKAGEVIGYRGAHVFPDSHAALEGEDPRHLYAVRFSAAALWGNEAPPGDSVTLDLFEPYLEAAT